MLTEIKKCVKGVMVHDLLFFSFSNGKKLKLNYLYFFHSQSVFRSIKILDQCDIEVTKILSMPRIWVSFYIIKSGSLQQTPLLVYSVEKKHISTNNIFHIKYMKNKWKNCQIKRFCVMLNSIIEKVHDNIFNVSKNNN